MKNKLFILFTLLSSIGLGQLPLTIEETISHALENNFQILIAKEELAQSENNNTVGNAGGMPRIDLQLNQAQTFQENNNPNSVLQGLFLVSNTTPNLELQWTIFNGFRIQANKEVLNRMVELSENNEQLIVQNVIHTTYLAYFQCQMDQAMTNALKMNMQFSKDRWMQALEEKKIGLISSFEVQNARINYLNDSSSYMLQQQATANSFRNLNRLLVMDLETDILLKDSIPLVTKSLNLDTLEASISNNRDLRAILINSTLIQQQERIAMSNYYPSINASFGGNMTSVYVNADAFSGRAPLSWQGYLNFTLSWNLFNGGQTRTAIRDVQSDLRINHLQEKEMQNEIGFGLATAYYNFKDLQVLSNLDQERLESSQVLFDRSKAQLDAGLITSFDFRTVQLQHINNELTTLNRQFLLLQQYLEILRLTNQLDLKTLMAL